MKFRKFVGLLSNPLNGLSIEVPFCASSESSAFKCLKSYGSFKIDELYDVTDRYSISLIRVASALSEAGFDDKEISFICDALERTGVGYSVEIPV